MLERKLFIAERSTTMSAKVGTAVPAKSELKAASNERKANNNAEPNNHAIIKRSGDASGLGKNLSLGYYLSFTSSLDFTFNGFFFLLCFVGRKEIRRQPSTLAKGLANLSSNGACINEIHRPILQRSVSQAAESTGRDNKGKDAGICNISRQAAQASDQILRCQKCKETGHSTQYCSINKLHLSAVKPSAESISREGNITSNKWKEIVGSAILRTRMQSSKWLDQDEETSISNTAMSFNKPDLPNSPSLRLQRKLSSVEGRSDGQWKRIDEVGSRTCSVGVKEHIVSLSC